MKVTKIEVASPGIRLEMDQDDARCLIRSLRDACDLGYGMSWTPTLLQLKRAIEGELE